RSFRADEEDSAYLAVTFSTRLSPADGHDVEPGVLLVQALQCAGELFGTVVTVQHPLGPGGHRFRQGHQPGGMPGWGSVADDEVELRAIGLHGRGDPFEHRRLVSSRRLPRELKMLTHL